MNYIVILKEEKTDIIKKFNEIKKWFILNFYMNIKVKFFYEDKINLAEFIDNSFYIISPNVFPLLNSNHLEDTLTYKNCFSEINDNIIAYIYCKEPLSKINNIVKFKILLDILKMLPTCVNGLLKDFNNKMDKYKGWFYIDDHKIQNFLYYLKNYYFKWDIINQIKLQIANRYPKIIYYDGKNKFESKKIVEKLNINMPKTYKIFNCLKEITQCEINKLPNCIIKPTNWDGGKYIFKNFVRKPLNSNTLVNKLNNYDQKNIRKEIMGLIYKTHKPSIIAEEYINDLSNNPSSPCEFKFYVFNRKILFLLAINRKESINKFDFYDENFIQFPNTKYSYNRTQNNFKWPKFDYFEKLKEDVYKIYDMFNKDLENSFIGRFIRIDFFVNKENYWFGEFSLFPNGGKGGNLNTFGESEFIKNWLPEVFAILS